MAGSSWQLQLISHILMAPTNEAGVKAFEAARAFGIQDIMLSGEARLYWTRILAYYSRTHRHGRVPSMQRMQEDFPSISLPGSVEDVEDVCQQIKHAHMRRVVDEAYEDYVRQVETKNNIEQAVQDFTAKLETVQTVCTLNKDVSFTDVARREVMADLQKRSEATNGLTGLPWPWDEMNERTQGIQASSFILVWATPKSGKTWLGLMTCAHLLQEGYKVLVYSKEMTWEIIRNRLACIMAKVNYGDFQKGKLDVKQRMLVDDALAVVCDKDRTGRLYFTQADRLDGGPGGPAEIRRKVDMYKPDFVMLDSSYMLEMPGSANNALDWKNLSMLTRELKQIAINTGVAILAISQENERAALKYKGTRGTASMAFNTNSAADCDLGIRVVLNKKEQIMSLWFAIARENDSDGLSIHAKFCEDMSYESDRLFNVGDGCEDEAPALPGGGHGAAPGTPAVGEGTKADTAVAAVAHQTAAAVAATAAETAAIAQAATQAVARSQGAQFRRGMAGPSRLPAARPNLTAHDPIAQAINEQKQERAATAQEAS